MGCSKGDALFGFGDLGSAPMPPVERGRCAEAIY